MSHPAPISVKWPHSVYILFRSVLGWALAALLGLLAAWATRSLGVSNMAAAQITIGMVGLGGGWSHSLLIRKAGGQASWRNHLLISVTWALICIVGVTPLFFIMGSACKLEMMAFYSFAGSGALGGIVTALATRPLFSNDYSREVLPCTLIWSFSLGLAAIGSDLLGERLQTFIPAALAWSAAVGISVLIMGCGAGFSILRFLRTVDLKRPEAFLAPRIGTHLFEPKEKDPIYVWTLILLCTPFYLNDLANIYVTDWRLWLLIDYTSVKFFPFLLILWLIRTKRMSLSEFGLTKQAPISFVIVFIIGTLTVAFIMQNGILVLNGLPSYSALGKMPEIQSPLWYWIDLTLGLLMVALFEELVFRGYLYTFMIRFTRRRSIIVGLSGIAFGLIHWSDGLHSVMLSGAAGAIFMLLYLQTLALPAIMLAHFAVDFVECANIIPKPIFRAF